ncbi:MBL fold metallo-hydrolase [Ensifer sp. IC4062]|nr:MBL fold metallo-hydrolase [Ensifer sp. IC4062]MCA1443137.1 MBL fold metallo-hydrolase [Ensifer sp. IC4062]
MESEKAAYADRRDLLKLTVLAGLAGMVPIPASAQEQATLSPPARPLPTVDTRFPAEIAPGAFLVPDKRIPLVPNIGTIVGTESVLVVDCGLGIESAENVLRLTRELAPGRRIILTVTHAHPEHGFGAQVFRSDARIYYNSAQRDFLQRSGQILLDGFKAGILPDGQKHLLDGIKLTPPHETYDTAETVIDLGSREVRLRTWGTTHSPGDQIVFLPQERILFAGDLLEERMFPIVPFFPPMIGAGDIDVAKWETALNDMMRLQPRLIVPGHGNLGGAELPEAVLGYFQTVREMLAEAGPETASLPSLLRARYATWENPEFISPALRYFQQRA